MKNTITHEEELSKIINIRDHINTMTKRISQYRNRKIRLRAIFKLFRRQVRTNKYYKYWSDLILLNTVVNTLNELKMPYCKNEICSAFNLTDIKDYHGERKLKNILLKSLLKHASKKSVFK
ncbi:hypothetical protein KAJ89_02405 [Candidatus Parcubacteria bacterium]|nr:hypothetical protein [Candidatus Parcubacteria bacterium]